MTKIASDLAYEFLKEKDKATFNQIWKYVFDNKKNEWKEETDKLLKEIEEEKIGEFYTILTVDGRFIRVADDKWSLVENFTFEETKSLRASAVENE